MVDPPASAPEVIAVTVAPPKPTPTRRQSQFQAKDEKLLVVTSAPSLISSAHKGTSLLLSNNPPKLQTQHSQQEVRHWLLNKIRMYRENVFRIM